MRKDYLVQVTFEDGPHLRWPDGSAFPVFRLVGPLNEDNKLVEELLFRGVGNKFGIGTKVLREMEENEIE